MVAAYVCYGYLREDSFNSQPSGAVIKATTTKRNYLRARGRILKTSVDTRALPYRFRIYLILHVKCCLSF